MSLDAAGQRGIFGRMRTIPVWICMITLMATPLPRVRAQDAATQQQLDKITGQIQDVQDALAQQDKRIAGLEKKVADLEDKLNTPQGNNYASADDLKNLAKEVEEIDHKRQEDNQKILDAISKLGRGAGESHRSPAINPGPIPPNPTPISQNPGTSPGPDGQQNGYEYTIAPGNTLSAIAKAYRAQGVKVSVEDIIKANPGLNPNSLIVGKKIFIPAPQ